MHANEGYVTGLPSPQLTISMTDDTHADAYPSGLRLALESEAS